MNLPPPPATTLTTKLLPLLQRIKSFYILWFRIYQILPKTQRYSLGYRIDTLLVEIMEAVSIASFLPKEERRSYVCLSIRKIDTVKVLLMVLWETKSLDNKQYITLSAELDEIGRMAGGWNGQLLKQNSPAKTGEK